MLVVFVQRPVTTRPLPVSQRLGVAVLGIGPDPVVDALPGHAKHVGDVGCGAPLVVLQDSQGAPQEAGVKGFLQLAPQAVPLPRGQVESAHALLPHRWGGT